MAATLFKTAVLALMMAMVVASLMDDSGMSEEEEVCPQLQQDVEQCSNLMSTPGIQTVAAVCAKGREVLQCVEDLLDECEGHPSLQALRDALDAGRQSLGSMCPNPACANVRSDLAQCSNIAMAMMSNKGSLNVEQICQKGSEFLQCVEEVEERCSTHPSMTSIRRVLGTLRQQIDTSCSHLDESSSEDESEDEDENASEEDTSDERCPDDPLGFSQEVGSCMEGMEYTCSGMQSVVDCVEGLVDACSGRDWMTGSAAQQIQSSLDTFRGMRHQMSCSD